MTTLEAVLHPARALGAGPLGRNVALGLLLAVLLFLTAYPMGMLVYGSLHTTPPGAAGSFNLDGYRAMLSRSNAFVLLNTIGLSLVKTGLALVLALGVISCVAAFLIVNGGWSF